MNIFESIQILLNNGATLYFPYQNRAKLTRNATNKFVFITRIDAYYQDDKMELSHCYFVGFTSEFDFKFPRDLDDVKGTKQFLPEKLNNGIVHFIEKALSVKNYKYLQKRIIDKGIVPHPNDFNKTFMFNYTVNGECIDPNIQHTEKLNKLYESEAALIQEELDAMNVKNIDLPVYISADLKDIYNALEVAVKELLTVEFPYRTQLKPPNIQDRIPGRFFAISLSPKLKNHYQILRQHVYSMYDNEINYYNFAHSLQKFLGYAFSPDNYSIIEWRVRCSTLRTPVKNEQIKAESATLALEWSNSGLEKNEKRQGDILSLLQDELSFESFETLLNFIKELRLNYPEQIREMHFSLNFENGFASLEIDLAYELFSDMFWIESSNGDFSIKKLQRLQLNIDLISEQDSISRFVSISLNNLIP